MPTRDIPDYRAASAHLASIDADWARLVEQVGRWTVGMLLIFTLERADVLPVDDFGVRNGYRRLKGLDKLPTPRELARIGQAYSPWRTVAAWYLWRVPAP